MEIICITGIDGAGKSTLAKNLVIALRDEGRSAHYLYGRIVPVISRVLMIFGRFAFIRKKDPKREFNDYSVTKKKVMRSSILRTVYTAAVFFDCYIQIWSKLCLQVFRNRTLVIDRYIYDTIISDLAVHLEYSEIFVKKIIDRSFRFVPRPKLTVLLDLPEEIAFSRKNDIPHIDYLRERRHYFLELQSLPEVHLFEGDQPRKQLLDSIIVFYLNSDKA